MRDATRDPPYMLLLAEFSKPWLVVASPTGRRTRPASPSASSPLSSRWPRRRARWRPPPVPALAVDDESKAANKSLSELVDTAAQVLLYLSSALSFSVDDFGTCGRHRVAGVCKDSDEFCQRVRASGTTSRWADDGVAAVALAASTSRTCRS